MTPWRGPSPGPLELPPGGEPLEFPPCGGPHGGYPLERTHWWGRPGVNALVGTLGWDAPVFGHTGGDNLDGTP